MPEPRAVASLLVAFVDLTRFAAQSQRVDDVELADTIDAYYEHVGAAVLIVFEADQVDRGVEALLGLKESIDRLMTQRGWECRLVAKAHFGTAIAGLFGVVGDKHHDVIGKAVNTTVALDGSGVTLSVAAFRKLGPVLRRRFKKHTPPVSYIRIEDPRRFR
jgi:class 3 adenylate cyclase